MCFLFLFLFTMGNDVGGRGGEIAPPPPPARLRLLLVRNTLVSFGPLIVVDSRVQVLFEASILNCSWSLEGNCLKQRLTPGLVCFG